MQPDRSALRSHVVRRRGISSSLVIAILAVVVLMAAIGAALYVITVRNPREAHLETQNELLAKTIGIAEPVKNSLDARYTDADGDGLADPPKDAKDQLDPPTLTFSYVAVEDPAEFKTAFKDFIAHLSKVTGKPVEYMEVGSTQEQLAALRDGKLQVTGFSTGNVPIAVDAAGFHPVVALAGAEGKGLIQTQIIVPADSSIRSVSELRGHELTLSEPGSNAGYKAPLVHLMNDVHLMPGKDYGIRYSGGYDASIAGIASKQFQAAAVASDVLKRDTAAGKIKPEQYRVIDTWGEFPTAGLGYCYNLKSDLAAKVQEAFKSFDWKGTSMEGGFAGAGQSRFVPADYKADWQQVRDIDEAMGFAHKLTEPTTQPAPTAQGPSK